MGLRKIRLEEGVDCLLSGGETYVIFFKVRVGVVQAGLMMGCVTSTLDYFNYLII